MKATLKSVAAGAAAGALTTAATWLVAEYVWDWLAAGVGAILSMGFGGPAPPPPSLSRDWAGRGAVVGSVAGAGVGLCVGLTGRDVRGRAVGMLAAAVCWGVGAGTAWSAAGLMLLEGALFGLAVGLLVASVLAGALVGAATDFLFRRLGRRGKESKESSAL